MKSARIFKKPILFGLCLVACLLFKGASLSAQSAAGSPSSNPTQNNSVGLEGTVKSDPPTTAPTITVPGSGQSFNNLPVNVGGLCKADLLVKLFKNGVFAGSAQCSGGAYTISTDLFNGANELTARQYDALDQASPPSNTVNVTFTQTGFNTNGPRISLTSNYARRGANPNDTLTWPIILSGGSGPYAISVDWGDGITELVSRSQAGEFTINHKYASPGVYTILIKGTDSTGDSAFLQLVAVGNGALVQDDQGDGANTTVRTIIIWWPLIVAAFLVLLSFWLGRRHQLVSLRKQAEKRVNY